MLKNKKNYGTKFYIWITIIVGANFFGLYQILAPITQIYFTDMICLVLFPISLIYLFHNSNGVIVIDYHISARTFTYLFLLIALVEIILSGLRYREYQSGFELIKESLVPITIIVLSFAWHKAANIVAVEYIIQVLEKVAIICSVMGIVAYVLLDKFSNNFLNLDITEFSFYRYGKPHFMIGAMVVVPALLFSAVKIINKKADSLDYVCFIFGMVHVVGIGKTRTLIVYIFITILITYVFKTNRTSAVKIVVVIMAISVYITMEASILIQNARIMFEDNSLVYRLEAIEYYLKQLMNHPLFGMGFISSGNVNLQSLLSGIHHRFYRSDVGFIGFINQYGCIGGFWYICMIIYLFKVYKRNKYLGNNLTNKYLGTFLLFIVLSSTNLSAFDSFRIIYYPILFLLVSEKEDDVDSKLLEES